MNNFTSTLVTVLASIIGLAMVAVIVSRKAQTPQVVQAGGSALAAVIGAAVAPVAGNNNATNFGAGANTGTGGLLG